MMDRALPHPKVRRLLPLLGSPKPENRLRTLDQIAKVLAADGLSFADLAAVTITDARMLAPAASAAPTPSAPIYRPLRRKRWLLTPRLLARYRGTALRCRGADDGRLSEGDRAFLSDFIRSRAEPTIAGIDRLSRIASFLEQTVKVSA